MSAQEDDPRDLYELYALGILEEPERSQIEVAIRSGDPEARKRLREAMRNNAAMMAATELVEPPERLRGRVLSIAGVDNRAWGWRAFWVAATASLVLACVYLGARWNTEARELAAARTEVQRLLKEAVVANAELAQARNVLRFLEAAETRVVSFGPEDPKPRGRVLLNPRRGVLLIASNLPPAPAGRIYEMWIIAKGAGARPRAAGLFQTTGAGTALHLQEGEVAADSIVAVTLEPEAGSEQPTTPPLFAAGV
ncbi:MAG: anti-sigma factor [Bryobacterales bacterium]|nr:anti-sigma factor [Bryobacterales bacterium]